MNDMNKIDGRIQQAVRVTERAATVIANAQSRNWPYSSLPHPTRIFCAILAAQARELAERATKQVGLEVKSATADDRAAKIEKFFSDSAEHVDTGIDSMATARVAAQGTLITMALDLVARAERVLDGDEGLDGREIVHGALWDK